jgi:hypothetical protein
MVNATCLGLSNKDMGKSHTPRAFKPSKSARAWRRGFTVGKKGRAEIVATDSAVLRQRLTQELLDTHPIFAKDWRGSAGNSIPFRTNELFAYKSLGDGNCLISAVNAGVGLDLRVKDFGTKGKDGFSFEGLGKVLEGQPFEVKKHKQLANKPLQVFQQQDGVFLLRAFHKPSNAHHFVCWNASRHLIQDRNKVGAIVTGK